MDSVLVIMGFNNLYTSNSFSIQVRNPNISNHSTKLFFYLKRVHLYDNPQDKWKQPR